MIVRINTDKIAEWDTLPLEHRVMLKILQAHGGEMEEKELKILFELEMLRLKTN